MQLTGKRQFTSICPRNNVISLKKFECISKKSPHINVSLQQECKHDIE